MSEVRIVRIEELPDRQTGGRSPIYWGMLVLIAIEGTAFAALFSSYLYLRFLTPVWPPPGAPLPPILLPAINTPVLAAGALFVAVAYRRMRDGGRTSAMLLLLLSVVIGTKHLVLRIVTLTGARYGGAEHAFGSITVTTDIIHIAHVAAAILMSAVALALCSTDRVSVERPLGIQLVSLFWGFVLASWLGVLAVIHLVPRYL